MTGKMQENPKPRRRSPAKRDIGGRSAKFAEAIVKFARTVPASTVTRPLIAQLVRAGTSPGANYGEADEAVSAKDFRYSISICKKEARETKYWLQMIAAAVPELKSRARDLWKEANELHLIFAAIYRNAKVGR